MHVDTNLHKLKVEQNIFGWAWPEMGVASLITGLQNWLYLKNELIKLTDFLHGGANSGKQKVVSMIFGWAWSKLGVVN